MEALSKEFNQKIRNRMLKLVLTAATLVLVLLGIVSYFMARSLLHTEITAKTQNKITLAATQMNQWLNDKRLLLAMLTEIEKTSDLPTDIKKAYFLRLGKDYGTDSIYMGYKDGTFIDATLLPFPKDFDHRKRPWYTEAVSKDGPIFTKPYIDVLTDKYVTTVAYAIRVDGELKGVIALDLFMDMFVRETENLKMGEKSKSFLVLSNGLYLTHPNKDMVFNLNIQQSEDAELFELFSFTDQKSAVYEGKDKYIVFARIPAAGWYLVFHLPYSEVNRPLRKLTLIFVFGILVALLVLGITTSLISKFISQPILYLANGAGRIAEGHYETQVQVNSRDEVGYLTQCFNNMVKGLKERDFIKSTFGKYVTPQVMNEILAGKVELGGEKRTATILFSDIRDFTGFAEQMDPRTIVPLLNDYFTLMDAAVTKHHGSINKYLGDGFLAVFGAPLALENASMSSVQAAMDMRQALETFNLRNNMAFRVGIGIHTGVAVVGNIGSESRMEYTVIGDSVNVSSRIENLCKVYGQDMLISEDAAMCLPESYKQQIIDRVRVRGKQDTISLMVPHLVEESGASMMAFVRSSNEIMEHYFAGRFQEAIEMINALRKEQRESIHMQIIRSRCETFLKDPPADWEGVLPI